VGSGAAVRRSQRAGLRRGSQGGVGASCGRGGLGASREPNRRRVVWRRSTTPAGRTAVLRPCGCCYDAAAAGARARRRRNGPRGGVPTRVKAGRLRSTGRPLPTTAGGRPPRGQRGMERGGRARGQARPANPKWAENGALGPFKKIIFIF
jgi:hypothetical protein